MSINDYKFDVISVMNSIGEASNTNLILILQDGIAIGRLPLETDLEDDNSLIKLFNKCFKEFIFKKPRSLILSKSLFFR